MKRNAIVVTCWKFAGALVLALTAAAASATASQYKVLYSFCKKVGCGDGGFPLESMTFDQAGNLYGTAQKGAHDEGVVFELVKPIEGKKIWRYRVLYHFCARVNCADGRDPSGSTLILDSAGNIYGTTFGGGGGNDAGTVFELSPPVTGNQWTLRTLYSFCTAVSSCHDGANASGGLTYAGREAGLPYDGASPLYGVTEGGGGRFGGVAYSLVPKANGQWVERVLYAFCQTGDRQCTDGEKPARRMTMDSSGNLYGTTTGGANGAGVVFKLSAQQGQHKLTETVLYDFCDLCFDVSDLTFDHDGNLLGSSSKGRQGVCGGIGCGFIFKIAPDGTATEIYLFCSLTACADGYSPYNRGGLFLDGSGNIYGTTSSGGTNDEGVAFKLNGSTLTVLHSFCLEERCTDGAQPVGGLIMNAAGQLFGTTSGHGAYIDQTKIFELTP